MELFLTCLAGVGVVHGLVWRARRDRAGGLRLAAAWACVLAAAWTEGVWLPALALALFAWPLLRLALRKLGLLGRAPRLEAGLAAERYRDRERAIWQAAERADDEAFDALAAHLGRLDTAADEDELMTVFRALVKGWGAQAVSQRWDRLPARARADFLQLARGGAQFSRNDLLWLARRGMDDEQDAVAERAWATYEHAVDHALEAQLGDFDVYAWIQGTTEDPHPRIAALRARLIDGLRTRTQDAGVDALIADYKANVFIEARAARARLRATRDHALEDQHGAPLELPAGLHAASLTGHFDNAQNKVQEGWRLTCIVDDVAGARRRITATWQAEELFAELFDARHDGRRVAFEDAGAALTNAFATQAFVGPIAVYGEGWGRSAPRVGGARLALAPKQISMALVARLEEPDGAATLAFLHYELEDPEGEEHEPFITLVPLERLLLDELADENARELLVETD